MVVQLVNKVTHLKINLHFSSSTSVCLCSIDFTLLDLTTVTLIGEKYKLSVLHYKLFSSTITCYAFHPHISSLFVLRYTETVSFH